MGKKEEPEVPCASPRRPVVCSGVLGCCCSETAVMRPRHSYYTQGTNPASDVSHEAAPHVGTARDEYARRRLPPAAQWSWDTATHGAAGSAGTWTSSSPQPRASDPTILPASLFPHLFLSPTHSQKAFEESTYKTKHIMGLREENPKPHTGGKSATTKQ